MDNYDLLFSDDYAYESYDSLFDDSYSYGYAMEADEENDTTANSKKKSGIWETVKKILAKFREFVANFLQGIKNFLFGAKDEKGNVVKFGVAGYIGGLWKAAKADAEAKLRQDANNKSDNTSGFIAIEASDFSHAFEADNVSKLNDTLKLRKYEKKMHEKRSNYVAYWFNLMNKAEEAGDINIKKFLNQVAKSASRQTSNKYDTPYMAEAKKTVNEIVAVSGLAMKTAEQTSKGVEDDKDVSKFKAFIGTLSRFFKYLGGMIKLMVMSKSTSKLTRDTNVIRQSLIKPDEESSFIGRIARESYNEGYQAALHKYGYDYAKESYDDLFADDYAYESSDEYMRGYYAALADVSC